MVASVEAILVSTFVLIPKNKTAIQADQHDDLDLPISIFADISYPGFNTGYRYHQNEY